MPGTLTPATSPLTRTQFIDLVKGAPIAGDVVRGDGLDGCIIGALENTLIVPGLEITYSNHFEHPAGEPSAADPTDDCIDPWDVVTLELVVIDDEGRALDQDAITAILASETAICDLDLRLLGEDA